MHKVWRFYTRHSLLARSLGRFQFHVFQVQLYLHGSQHVPQALEHSKAHPSPFSSTKKASPWKVVLQIRNKNNYNQLFVYKTLMLFKKKWMKSFSLVSFVFALYMCRNVTWYMYFTLKFLFQMTNCTNFHLFYNTYNTNTMSSLFSASYTAFLKYHTSGKSLESSRSCSAATATPRSISGASVRTVSTKPWK